MDFNKVIIAGRLASPPENKFLPSGKAVCNVCIAVNRKSKGESKVTFIDCVAWEKTAELIGEYLVKGSPVLFEGYLDMQEWDDKKSGDKRRKLVLQVSNLQFFPKTDASSLQKQGGEYADEQRAKASSEFAGKQNETDIPF